MTTRPPTVKLGAAIVVGAGALAALMQLHPDKLRAPAWIALSAAGVLGVAGVCVIAQALRLHRLARWLVCGLLGAMAVIPGWIAFGGGPRQCSLIAFGARSAASETLCRGAFGVGTVSLLAMVALAVRGALRARHADQ